ncbi:hypothetical protein [Phenylobacterium sp.]|uniref:hypothetical protein n=1 Tax=Phenylobacterium sp. TaxID=1871053 RepID=UPI0027268BA6|nr:hypothetical protein [Phenylobacterium sp.]MDO8801773.1 hypothetical protein [Phenylobacterium sp.]
MRAITLTELLISIIIIGIIMIGVISSDSAVRKNAQNQNASTLLTLNTRAVVNAIINNASLISGYRNDQGYSPTANGFCFRRDFNITTNAPNDPPTPADYSDDQWMCYTVVASNLRSCVKTAASGPSSCLSSDTLVGAVVSVTPAFDATANVFSVTIVNRADPSQPKSISNPEVTVSARASPPGQSQGL